MGFAARAERKELKARARARASLCLCIRMVLRKAVFGFVGFRLRVEADLSEVPYLR